MITSWDNKIDFRYFPHPYAVSFYSFENEEVPVFLENIGFDTICAETPAGIIKLEPGDRKLVDEENAEQEQPIILREDLYAATFL